MCATRTLRSRGKLLSWPPEKIPVHARQYAAGGGGGGGGGVVAPQKFSKQKQTYTQILDFLIVVSVDQNIVQLK